MNNAGKEVKCLAEQNQKFYEKADRSFRGLFDVARRRNELHFAMALMVEMRGVTRRGMEYRNRSRSRV